jgi:hypothetical protein
MVAPGPDDQYWLKRRIVVTSAGAFHLRAIASNALSFAFKFRVTLTKRASIDLEMRSRKPSFIRPPEPATYWTSLLFAFRSTISLTDPQVQLTAWGSSFQALLRITGPVLLGLTLLALRAQVKR